MENTEEFETALQNVWQAIGSDVLEMCDNNTASKSEVIEMVLDANRINNFGNLTPELLSEWNSLDLCDKISVAKKSFNHSFYGY